MTVLFSPDVCQANDPVGFGRWLLGHHYEHEQMRQILISKSPPVAIPEYNILSWGESEKLVTTWLQTHQFIHDALDDALNVTSTDFSLVDFSNQEEFYIWMDNHRFTHQAYRTALGIT